MKDAIAKLRAAATARPSERIVDINLRVALAIADASEAFAAECERLTREMSAAITSLNEAAKFLVGFAGSNPTTTNPTTPDPSSVAQQSGGSGLPFSRTS